MPPKHEGIWFSREQNRAGTSIPQNPYLLPQLHAYAVAHTKGLDCDILDAQVENMSKDEVENYIQKRQYDMVVIVASIFALENDCNWSVDATTFVVFCPSTIRATDVLKFQDLQNDYLVEILPVETTIKFLQNYAIGKQSETDNILVKTGDGYKKNPVKPFKKADEVFEHVMPSFTLLPIEKYGDLQFRLHRTRKAMIVGQEGCPWTCNFCSKGIEKKFTEYPPEKLFEELSLLKILGYDDFHLMWNEIGARPKAAIALCDLIIENDLGITFSTNNRVDLMRPQLIDRLAEAGCTEMKCGIESGDPAVRDALEKRVSIDEINTAFEMLKAAGIKTTAYLMIGTPYEGPGSTDKTIELCKNLDVDHIALSVFYPTPCTQLYYDLESSGKLLEADWSKYRFGNKLLFKHDYFKNTKHLFAERNRLLRYIYRKVFFKKIRASKKLDKLINFAGYLATFNKYTYEIGERIYVKYLR